jgi:methylphosphotriester-DNA--protein-cysteine methyltransferase
VIYRTYTPARPLSEFIALFWYYEGLTQPHAKERVLPDNSMQLVINLVDDELVMYDRDDHATSIRHPGALFSGPRSGYLVIDTSAQSSLLGIHFRPGGIFPFVRMPACELYEQNLPVEDLWGRSARSFRARVLEPHTPEGKFRALERCMVELLVRRPERHPAALFAMNRLAGYQTAGRIGGLAEEIGISRRRLGQIFESEIGLTPKQFARVTRFQRALQEISGAREVHWTDVALACGYYDQPHFIHDFREFSGITPEEYVSNRTAHSNHVPLA